MLQELMKRSAHFDFDKTLKINLRESKEYTDELEKLSRYCCYITLKVNALLVRGLVVSYLRSETKGSRFECSYYLYAEVSSLQ